MTRFPHGFLCSYSVTVVVCHYSLLKKIGEKREQESHLSSIHLFLWNGLEWQSKYANSQTSEVCPQLNLKALCSITVTNHNLCVATIQLWSQSVDRGACILQESSLIYYYEWDIFPIEGTLFYFIFYTQNTQKYFIFISTSTSFFIVLKLSF